MSALGDTALTLPLAYFLKKHRPELRLGWVVGEQASLLLKGLDCIDFLHIFPQPGNGLSGLRQLMHEIRKRQYWLALDPQGISRSSVIPWLANIPYRVGFAPGKLESRELAPFFLNHFVQVPTSVKHITERTLYLGSVLGIKTFERPRCPLYLDPKAVKRTNDWWQSEGLGTNTLVMSIGAGWPTKVWPAERMKCLVELAVGAGISTVLLWGPLENHRLNGWRKLFRGTLVLAPPTNIQEMVALLNMAIGYAGPDSAALHLAWLLDKPTFSWFGASDPDRSAPQGPNHFHVASGIPNWRRSSLLGNPLKGLTEERVQPLFTTWLNKLQLT